MALAKWEKRSMGHSRAKQIWGVEAISNDRFMWELEQACSLDLAEYIRVSRVGMKGDDAIFGTRSKKVYFWNITNTIN